MNLKLGEKRKYLMKMLLKLLRHSLLLNGNVHYPAKPKQLDFYLKLSFQYLYRVYKPQSVVLTVRNASN